MYGYGKNLVVVYGHVKKILIAVKFLVGALFFFFFCFLVVGIFRHVILVME